MTCAPGGARRETRMNHDRDLGLLIPRLGFGLAFFWYHGYPKLAGGPEMWTRIGDAVSNVGITFGHPVWGLAAALSEGARRPAVCRRAALPAGVSGHAGRHGRGDDRTVGPRDAAARTRTQERLCPGGHVPRRSRAIHGQQTVQAPVMTRGPAVWLVGPAVRSSTSASFREGRSAPIAARDSPLSPD